MKGIVYKGQRILPGSQAYALWMVIAYGGNAKKLDSHLATLTREAQARGELL
jgi:hypothetical protein